MTGESKSFLRPWCEALARYLRVDTPRDAHATSDHTSQHSFYLQLDCAEGDALAIRRLREALLLTTLYKRVDPQSWAAETTQAVSRSEDRSCHLEGEKHLFDFTIKLNGSSAVWSMHLYRLFDTKSDTQGNATYDSALERLVQLGKSRKANVEDILSPVRIHLSFCPRTTTRAEQMEALTLFTDTVAAIRREEGHDVTSAPSLSLECVSLHLRRFELSSNVLHMVESVVKSGVGIQTLSLPGWIDESDESMVSVEVAWDALVRATFFGSAINALPTIERIELPHVYMIDALAIPFFSALKSATNVRSLRIQYNVTTATSSYHTARSFWTHLCRSVVCPPAGNALEILELDGFTSVPSVALLILRQLIADDRTTRSSALRQLVIHDDALVPGSLPTFGRYEAWRWLPLLLDLLGHSLTALAIDCKPVDESLVASCVARCPGLKSLRVTRAYFSSLEPLVEAYASKHCSISSLDLRSLTTPSSAIDAFLICLMAEESQIHGKLRSLHLGDSPDFAFNESTRRHFVALLQQNKQLHQLRITKCAGIFLGDKRDAWSQLRSLNGERMPGPHTPLETPAKLAFLSTVAHIGKTPAMPFLDRDSLRSVMLYAATPTLRRVVVDFDTKMATFFLG